VSCIDWSRPASQSANSSVVRACSGRASPHRCSSPLRELVERSVGAEALIRDVLEQTAGVEAAAIFGSWARGHVDAQSDIDLLVVGDFDYAHLVDELSQLQQRTGREINLVSMRPGELSGRHDGGFVQENMASPMRSLIGTLE
jgi:predicted nucleotidyltransferase